MTSKEVIDKAMQECLNNDFCMAESFTNEVLHALHEAGYAIVPIEPTARILDAGFSRHEDDEWTWADIWREMIEAAGKP